MVVTCEVCGVTYEDTYRLSWCPHDGFDLWCDACKGGMMSTVPNYRQGTWGGMPQHVCLLCGVSTVGEPRGLTRLTDHLQAMHAADPILASEPTEEPAEEPEKEPVEEPVEEPAGEPTAAPAEEVEA